VQSPEHRFLICNDQGRTFNQRCHGRVRQPADVFVSQRLKLLLTLRPSCSNERRRIEINAERPRPDAAVGRQVSANRAGHGIEEPGHVQSFRCVQQRY